MLLFKEKLLVIFLFIHPLSSAYSIEGSVSGNIESMVISDTPLCMKSPTQLLFKRSVCDGLYQGPEYDTNEYTEL